MPFSASDPLSITPATPPEPDDPPLAQPAAPISPPAPAAAPRPAERGCPRCAASPEPEDVYCGTCGEQLDRPAVEETVASPASSVSSPIPESAPAPTAIVAPRPALAPGSVPAVALAPAPSAVASTPPEPTLEPDTENTRLVPRGSPGARFVLQFSTGESYTVLGSGIIGRNPSPEPGEAVDHIVTIVDPGRSVSKSHLEFGQDNGVFWVSDRHSGNGSVIREPGSEARYCEPGRRYRVVRGTRIDIGEQFVVVS
ncbi:hypothetical protein FHX53_000358 [Yonghaparkia alkaliphila]|uniref:FHA domain-containing protein n=2 Tax=Microcella alkalica TaxID=355930 RepID=A0A839E9E1_9MICO|nr:hypothetical protein [Microcella alkalica]